MRIEPGTFLFRNETVESIKRFKKAVLRKLRPGGNELRNRNKS